MYLKPPQVLPDNIFDKIHTPRLNRELMYLEIDPSLTFPFKTNKPR